VFVLGNGAIWALGFLAGPGFQVAVGATISPAAAHPGLMPLVPVLAALPDEADYPPLAFAALLVPVVAGVVIARWVDAELEFFGNGRARAGAVATAATIAVLAVSALAALGNGAMGVERLSAVGVPWAWFTGALLLEVVGGALGLAGWRSWRESGAKLDQSTEYDETIVTAVTDETAETAGSGAAGGGTEPDQI
jgi:hypothetical protein